MKSLSIAMLFTPLVLLCIYIGYAFLNLYSPNNKETDSTTMLDLLLKPSNQTLFTEDKGTTKISWMDDSKHRLKCQFNRSEAGYRCGVDHAVGHIKPYIADRTKVNFIFEYTGPANNVRLYFLNSHVKKEGVFPLGVRKQIVLPIRPGLNSLHLSLDKFDFPTWWKHRYPGEMGLDYLQQTQHVTNIGFDINTPMEPGSHEFNF